jgi:hypothetical protein
MEEEKQENLLAQVKAAMESETVPKIYVNGFINSYGAADVVLVFQQNGKNMIVVNMSYTTAKTLAEKFSALIKAFEQTTEHEIMSIDTVKAKIAKQKGNDKGNASLQ